MDMDEVFSDFVSAAAEAHGFEPGEIAHARIEHQLWSMAEVMTILRGRLMTQQEFWAPIHSLGESFWIRLQPLPWAIQLLGVLQESGLEWHILSSPARGVQAYTGKVRWIQDFFGPNFDRFILTPHKHLLARPGTVLVDDRPENLESFAHRRRGSRRYPTGGQGVLFPNSPFAHEDDRKDPVKTVRELVKRIQATQDLQGNL